MKFKIKPQYSCYIENNKDTKKLKLFGFKFENISTNRWDPYDSMKDYIRPVPLEMDLESLEQVKELAKDLESTLHMSFEEDMPTIVLINNLNI